MKFIDFLDALPGGGIFLFTFAVAFLSIETGSYVGRRRLKKLASKEKVYARPIVAACLSLLAFMLAIVYSAVDFRFNELKHVVLDEANAIGTTFLRADLLPDTHRTEVRHLLRDYVDLRVEIAQSIEDDRDQIEQAVKKSEEIHNKLWSSAVSIAAQQPTPISALFVQSLNELIDMHEKRITVGVHHRLPVELWTMLYGLAILALMMGGYDSGLSGSRRVFAVTLTAAIAFSVVLTFVISLDRSHHRLSAPMQLVMIDVQESIHRSLQSNP